MKENIYKENLDISKIKFNRTAVFVANVFLALSIVFFLTMVGFNILFSESYVDGPSMQPTINSQWTEENPTQMDTAIYSKYFKAEKGDIIIAKIPNEDKSAIKRLIAIGGDTIYILNNTIYVNNSALNEPYLYNTQINGVTESSFETYCEVNESFEWINFSNDLNTYVMTIPQNYIFFLGDNRAVSNDCSIFGPQPMSSYEGKVLFVVPYGQNTIEYLWHSLWQTV